MKLFRSLDEFRDYSRSLDGVDEAEKVLDLSNAFLVDPVVVEMPADPFSEAYRRAVLDIHARITGRACYDATTMEHAQPDVARFAARSAACPLDSHRLGNHLESLGRLIKRLDVRPGMRVAEFGSGDAELSLQLARFGCDTTVFDIEPACLEVVRRAAEGMDVPIRTMLGDLVDAAGLEPFDRIVVLAFRRSLEHDRAIANCSGMLRDGGFVVFGAEAVIDPGGPRRHAVPYPWGPRLDGLSLQAMQTHGGMELGFQSPYFEHLLARHGLGCERESSPGDSLASSIVSHRMAVGVRTWPAGPAGSFAEPKIDLASGWRESMLSIIGTRDGDWLVSDGREGVVLYGPYMPLDAGDYLAIFEIGCDPAAARKGTIATCDIAFGNEGQRLTSIEVCSVDAGQPLKVFLPFSLPAATDGMQFRVISADGIPIRVRGHVVIERTAFAKAA